MSIFSKIWKAVRKPVGTVIGGLIGGPVGAIAGGVLAGGAKRPTGTAMVPMATRTLPGVGAVTAGVAGAAAGGLAALTGARAVQAIDPATGKPVRKRRRRRGITATELKNHARVERFLDKNYKCKRGGTRGTYVRKTRRS